MFVFFRLIYNLFVLFLVVEYLDGIDFDELLNDFIGIVWIFICYIVMKVKSI